MIPAIISHLISDGGNYIIDSLPLIKAPQYVNFINQPNQAFLEYIIHDPAVIAHFQHFGIHNSFMIQIDLRHERTVAFVLYGKYDNW